MTNQEQHYCLQGVCIRWVLPPHIYCDKHVDNASTPRDLVGMLKKYSDRFHGVVPEEKMIVNFLKDMEQDNVSN